MVAQAECQQLPCWQYHVGVAREDALALRVVNPQLDSLALAVVPRQIPFHAGFVYFELERSDARFRELKGSGGIAIHVPESFPGLSMELWAIRG